MANCYVRSVGGDTLNPASYTVVGLTPPHAQEQIVSYAQYC